MIDRYVYVLWVEEGDEDYIARIFSDEQLAYDVANSYFNDETTYVEKHKLFEAEGAFD